MQSRQILIYFYKAIFSIYSNSKTWCIILMRVLQAFIMYIYIASFLQQYSAFSSDSSMKVTHIQYPNLSLKCHLSLFLLVLSHLQYVSVIDDCCNLFLSIYILTSILVLLYFTCISTRQEVESKYRAQCIGDVVLLISKYIEIQG